MGSGSLTPVGQLVIRTTSLSLARSLWFYGEDDLWPRARTLPTPQLLEVGAHAGTLYTPQNEQRLGIRLTASLAMVLAAIELWEGQPRLPARTRRRPENQMPAELRATKDQLWSDPQLRETVPTQPES